MSEILFRGKDIQGNWHIGLLAHMGNGWYISNKAGVSTAYEVIPGTVGQYTGLTDKYGNKIFEGDILAVGENGKQYQTVSVSFKDGAFRVSRYAINLLESRNVESEVVGNIHDNPELLKGGAK